MQLIQTVFINYNLITVILFLHRSRLAGSVVFSTWTIHSWVTKLVSMIFWKWMNHFKCKLAPSNLLRKGMKMIDFGGLVRGQVHGSWKSLWWHSLRRILTTSDRCVIYRLQYAKCPLRYNNPYLQVKGQGHSHCLQLSSYSVLQLNANITHWSDWMTCAVVDDTCSMSPVIAVDHKQYVFTRPLAETHLVCIKTSV